MLSAMKDFSKVRKPIQFRIDGDVFDATPAIPAQVMIDFTEQITNADPTQMSPKEQVGLLAGMLEIVLLPRSLKRFKERMADVENPIGLDQINDVVEWLFEEYGLRPTTESSSSSNGGSPPGTGTTSTDSTPAGELISAGSLSTSF
jgi:hypothetical protein